MKIFDLQNHQHFLKMDFEIKGSVTSQKSLKFTQIEVECQISTKFQAKFLVSSMEIAKN